MNAYKELVVKKKLITCFAFLFVIAASTFADDSVEWEEWAYLAKDHNVVYEIRFAGHEDDTFSYQIQMTNKNDYAVEAQFGPIEFTRSGKTKTHQAKEYLQLAPGERGCLDQKYVWRLNKKGSIEYNFFTEVTPQ